MWQGLGFLQGSGPRKRCAIGQGLRQAHRRFWGEAGASRTWVSNLTRRIKEVQRRRRHREARPHCLSGHHHTQPPPRAISVLCSTVGFGGLWALRKLGHLEGDRGCLLRRTALARAVTNGRLLLPKHRGPLCSSFPVEESLQQDTRPGVPRPPPLLHHLCQDIPLPQHPDPDTGRPPSHQTHPRHLG